MKTVVSPSTKKQLAFMMGWGVISGALFHLTYAAGVASLVGSLCYAIKRG